MFFWFHPYNKCQRQPVLAKISNISRITILHLQTLPPSNSRLTRSTYVKFWQFLIFKGVTLHYFCLETARKLLILRTTWKILPEKENKKRFAIYFPHWKYPYGEAGNYSSTPAKQVACFTYACLGYVRPIRALALSIRAGREKYALGKISLYNCVKTDRNLRRGWRIQKIETENVFLLLKDYFTSIIINNRGITCPKGIGQICLQEKRRKNF